MAATQAVSLYCDAILRMHWNERLINKIFGRAMQSHAAGRLVVQHYRWQLEGAARPTLTRLQHAIPQGARTLATFFSILRLAGMITVEIDPADRRVRYLVPLPPLVHGLRRWMAHHLRCAEMLGLLTPGCGERLETEDCFFSTFTCRAEMIIERVAEARGRCGGWDWFDARDGGGRIAMLLLREHCRMELAAMHADLDATHESDRCAQVHSTDQSPSFALSTRKLAERLGLSYSHVRGMLTEAVGEGYLNPKAGRGRAALTPRLQADLAGWLLMLLGWFADAAVAAGWSASGLPPQAADRLQGFLEQSA